MAEDWAADVKKYVPDADDTVIAGIVRYCGIALRSRDSSLVSFTDPAETGRVRDGFCRKKLALTESDAEVDAAIARVGERMKGDATRNRVTVYYLLADAFGKLGLFGGGAAKAATPATARVAPATSAAPAATAATTTAAAAAATAATATPLFTAPAAAAAPLHATPAAVPMPPAVHPAARIDDADSGGPGTTALIGCGVMALIILGTATAASLFGSRHEKVAVDPPAVFATPAEPAADATAPATAAIPEGAGVVAQEQAGKPSVSVYFDTGKTDIAPDFAAAVAPVKAWLDGHAGARLGVSGFNDPTGNAAANAELSKNRAKSVAAALAAQGVPAAAIDLDKPPETTDAGTSPAQARRVDIVVKDAS